MFRHRFVCTDKENVLYKINQAITNDLPRGKSIFGSDLYTSGIHFQQCDEHIKGFYLADSENESHRGSPIRVCFYGRFVEENRNLFVDVYVYPRIIEVLFLIAAFIFLSLSGKAIGFMISVVVLCLFGKGYYDMIKDTYHRLNRIFN